MNPPAHKNFSRHVAAWLLTGLLLLVAGCSNFPANAPAPMATQTPAR